MINLKKIAIIGEKINRHTLVALSGITEKYFQNKKMEIKQFHYSEIDQILRRHFDILLVTFFSGQLPYIDKMIKKTKKNKISPIITGGGPHASGDPVSCLNLGFDYVLRGEGEYSLPLFFDFLKEKIPYSQVPGLSFKNQNRITHNPVAPFIPLDEGCNYSSTMESTYPIEITRGCPHGCKFCQVSSLFGKKPRHRSIESILSYIDKGQRYVRFVSPNAFSYGSKPRKKINYQQITDLLEAIKKKDNELDIFFGSFPCEVRPEYVDSEILKITKKLTNTKTIAMGAQSGSNQQLLEMNRGHTAEDVLNAADCILKNGFKCKIDFIFGLPGETEETIMETIKFIEILLKMRIEPRLHTFIPLPGTAYANEKPGKIPPFTRRFLNQLVGKGLAAGPWQNKEKINIYLTHFHQNKIKSFNKGKI